MSLFPLIVGLGNPGRQYEATRHNIGFMVLDRLAASAGNTFESKPRWQAHAAKFDSSLLIKPQTFMNLSGRAVRQVMAFHKWTPQQVLVVFDDVALPLGTLRFREKGSHGGHNGIRSMIEHLGTDHFPRLKIGIGGSEKSSLTGHVLGAFSEEEQPILEKTLELAVQAVQLARSQGVALAANRYNTSPLQKDEPQIPRPGHSQPEGN